MEVDWSTLRRLRQEFLEGTAGARDYWQSPADLAQYDATFAQRIGWKWDFVLNDLRQLGWRPPAGTVLDWGCGSGVAGRAFMDHFGTDEVGELWVSDRSKLAVEFAVNRAREKLPNLNVQPGIPDHVDLLIISHVLTELTPVDIEELIARISTATSVIWVEPGTFAASHTLIAIRERLRGSFNIVAPCPHQKRCAIPASVREGHWCHQFATPPAFVFTDAFWALFSKTLEIDLRSLPLSYLVLDRRPVNVLPSDAVRVLGRPEISKPHVSLLGCTDGNLVKGTIAKRTDPEGYRELKKGRCPSLQRWTREGTTITSRTALPTKAET